MILSGGGRNFTVPGKNIKVSVSLPIERKDLSGDGSTSSFASAGEKAQTVSVSLIIEKEKDDDLKNLIEVAIATDTAGNPVEYTIGDDQCEARKIKKVIFDGNLNSSDSDGLQAWEVSFSLKEVSTVPQKKEERAKEIAVQSVKDQDVQNIAAGEGGTMTDDDIQAAKQLAMQDSENGKISGESVNDVVRINGNSPEMIAETLKYKNGSNVQYGVPVTTVTTAANV